MRLERDRDTGYYINSRFWLEPGVVEDIMGYTPTEIVIAACEGGLSFRTVGSARSVPVTDAAILARIGLVVSADGFRLERPPVPPMGDAGTVTVYRYENQVTGLGPYSPVQWPEEMQHMASEMCESHSTGEHPDMWDALRRADGSYFIEYGVPAEHMHAACASPSELVAWFRGFHRPLRAAGFVLATYTVPANRAWLGKFGQVTFSRPDAVRV